MASVPEGQRAVFVCPNVLHSIQDKFFGVDFDGEFVARGSAPPVVYEMHEQEGAVLHHVDHGQIGISAAGRGGRAARAPLARLWQASGSLMADNLRRGRGRVTVTALTFAVSVMTVVGVTGVFNFFGKVLIDHAQETRFQNGLVPGWSIGAADFTQGVMNIGGIVDALDPEVVAEVYRVAEGRATVGVERPVVVPEIAAVLVPNYFSSMIDLNLLAVPGNVRFIEGDLETALPIMEAGCGVLLAPGAAARRTPPSWQWKSWRSGTRRSASDSSPTRRNSPTTWPLATARCARNWEDPDPDPDAGVDGGADGGV